MGFFKNQAKATRTVEKQPTNSQAAVGVEKRIKKKDKIPGKDLKARQMNRKDTGGADVLSKWRRVAVSGHR